MKENSEKELLKQDLNNQENPAEIKKFIEDVELMGENEDIVEMAKQKLEAILAKANTVEKTSESQISQVESMGGSSGEIEKRTEGIDKEIEEVKTETVKNIEEVKNEENEIKNEKYKNLPEEVRKSLLSAERHIEHEQQQINEMKQILDSYKQDRNNKTNAQSYNDAVLMVQSMADIVGDGNYGFGLDILRNPDTYHNILAEGQLQNTEVSMSYPREDHGKYKSSNYEYPPDTIDLKEKSKRLDSEFRNLMIEAKKIREDARNLA